MTDPLPRVEELQQLLLEATDPKIRAAAHLELGRIAMGEGRIEAGVRHLREALLLDPRLEAARQLLGDLGEASRITVHTMRDRKSAVRALLGRFRRS
jgi:hypothetical protein